MKKLSLSACILFSYCLAFSQTYNLGINPSPSCGGCAAACDAAGFCTPAGTGTGSCVPNLTVYTPDVIVPANSNVRIQITTRVCNGTTDGLEASDFLSINGVTFLSGGGRVNSDLCYFTGATSSTVSIGLSADRRDETVQVIFTVTSGSGTGCNALPAALKITLSSFAANVVSAGKIKINWVTENEINNDYISLEKSTDGYSFSEIQRNLSNGNSFSQKQYEYVDDKAFSKICYYRLKIVEKGGAVSYSNIIVIHNGDNKMQITVVPDFAGKQVKVYSNGISFINKTELYNASGTLVNVMKTANSSYLTVDVKTMPSGIYFLKTFTNKETYLNKIWVP